jgi:hypothetical protein
MSYTHIHAVSMIHFLQSRSLAPWLASRPLSPAPTRNSPSNASQMQMLLRLCGDEVARRRRTRAGER